MVKPTPFRLFFCCIAFGLHPTVEAQLSPSNGWHIEAGVSSHVSGYSGDIGHQGQYGILSDTQWHLIRLGVGVSVRAQQPGKRIGWNIDCRHIRIQGADSASNNAVAFMRNLHFRNDMIEIAATADFPLLRFSGQLGPWSLSHHLRAEGGLALLHHAPKAQVDRDNLCYAILNELGVNTPGQWHDLRGLETEGAAYAQWVMTLPIGFSYTFSADRGNGRPWHMTLTGLYRFTRTDRLDDIESQYANPWEMSPLGLGLSSQSNPSDIPPCANATNISTYQYQQGLSAERQAIRGNSATRDAYWTLGLTLAKSLTASTSNVFHKKRFRGQKVVNKR
jgi:hypothetical protein